MRIIVVLLLAGFVVASAKADEFHIFTDTQGRVVEGKITSVNLTGKRIQIERKDGRRVWVPTTIFSIEDEVYIKDWIAAYHILDNSSLRISMKKEHKEIRKAVKTTASFEKKKPTESVYFTVSFENRTNTSIDGLKVEYKYFIKIKGYGSRKNSERVVSGSLYTSQLAPRKSLEFSTKAEELDETFMNQQEAAYNVYGQVTYRNSKKKLAQEELEGIWIRVYGPSVGDTPTYRDVTYPSGLDRKKKWKQPRAPIPRVGGMN